MFHYNRPTHKINLCSILFSRCLYHIKIKMVTTYHCINHTVNSWPQTHPASANGQTIENVQGSSPSRSKRPWVFLYQHSIHPVFQFHDDVIKWKYFPRNWSFVWGIRRSPVNSPHKGQWRGALMFSLICTWISGWVNNREAGDLRRNSVRYDVTVMLCNILFESFLSLQIRRLI